MARTFATAPAVPGVRHGAAACSVSADRVRSQPGVRFVATKGVPGGGRAREPGLGRSHSTGQAAGPAPLQRPPFRAESAAAPPPRSRSQEGGALPLPQDRPCHYDASQPQVVHIEGPIMLTAPHGLEVLRGGTLGERSRVHLRERWVTEIVLKLSQALACHLPSLMQSCSFVVWNAATARKQDEGNLDPNYLIADDFERSPWHRALREWKAAFAGTQIPLLHIDVHGKLDRKDNLELDVGTGAMAALWPEQPFAKRVHEAFCCNIEACFEGRRRYGFKQLPFAVQSDPELRGYNTRGFHTMAHQSVLLGIPAVQLELPRTMRRALLVEHVLFDRFAAAIATAYRSVFGAAATKLSPRSVPSHYPPTYADDAASAERPPPPIRGGLLVSPPDTAPRVLPPGPAMLTMARVGPHQRSHSTGALTGASSGSATSVYAAKGLRRPTKAAALCRQLLRELDLMGLIGTEDRMI